MTGTRRIRSFDASAFEVQIAAEVLDFDPGKAMDPKMARRMTRFIHLAMGAGKEAVAASGIDFAAMTPEQRDRVGVVVNTGGGGIESIIDGTHVHDTKGPRFVSAFAVPALSGSMAGCMLSMEYGLTGPVMTQVAACATSVIAFHDALRLIATGECDVVLTGGSEAPDRADGRRGPVEHDRAVQAQRLARRRPRGRSTRPATGSCWARARASSWWSRPSTRWRRGATPIAEILGGALTADAFHISAPDPTGRGQARAMTNAMRNSGVAPDEIDWIVAHGTSTSLNDSTETRAIKAGLRVRGGDARDLLPQVDDRAPRGRGRHRVGAGGARRHPRRGDLAHREPAHAGPGVRPGLRAARGARRRRWTRSRSTASASAARTRSRSSAASRREPGVRPSSAA